jgi:hypothetical protein
MEGCMPAYNAVQAFLARLRDGWRARNELAGIGERELGLIAAEFSMTAKDLQMLVERGPDGAHLLYERLNALGLSEDDVERAVGGLMRDLEKTCALCGEHKVCKKDLDRDPQGSEWKNYCPNALELDALTKLKGRLTV